VEYGMPIISSNNPVIINLISMSPDLDKNHNWQDAFIGKPACALHK
jgi:hypothetical protein